MIIHVKVKQQYFADVTMACEEDHQIEAYQQFVKV